MKIINKKILALMLGSLCVSGASLWGMKKQTTDTNLIYQGTDAVGSYSCSELYKAIESGDLQKVQELVKNGANIERVYENQHGYFTAPGAAIYCDQLEILKFFVEEQNYDIECFHKYANGDSCSALRMAMCFETLKIVKYLIEERKANIDVVFRFTDGDTCSALWVAIEFDNLDMFKYLVEERNANIEVVCEFSYGCTHSALKKAIQFNRLEIVKYLMEIVGVLFTDINTFDVCGKQAIMSYYDHGANYYRDGTIITPWPVNYFCLAARKEDILKMRELIKSDQSILTSEDKKSLMIGLDRRKKNKSFGELLWLLPWNKDELIAVKKHVSCEGKEQINDCMQKCALVRMAVNNKLTDFSVKFK